MIAIIEFNLFNRLLKYGEIEVDARSIIKSESPSIQELDSKTPLFEEDFEIVAIKLNVAIDNQETLIIRPENILEVHPISELGSRQLQPKIFSWIDLKAPLFEKEINEVRVHRRMGLGKRAFQAIITLSKIDGNLLDDKSKLINDFENGLKYRLFGIEVKDNSIVADIIKGDLLSGYGFEGFTNIYASILYYRYLYSNIGNKKNGFEDWSVFFDYVDGEGFGKFDSENPGKAYADSNIEKDLGGALDKFDFVVVSTFLYYRDLIQKNTLSGFKDFIRHLPGLKIDDKVKPIVAYMIGYFFGYSELFEGILDLLKEKNSIGFAKSQIIENHKLESEYNGAEKESSSSENENAGILVEDFAKKVEDIASNVSAKTKFSSSKVKKQLSTLGYGAKEMIPIDVALGIDLSEIDEKKWAKIYGQLSSYLRTLKRSESSNEAIPERKTIDASDNKELCSQTVITPKEQYKDKLLINSVEDVCLIVNRASDEFDRNIFDYDVSALRNFLLKQINWLIGAIKGEIKQKNGKPWGYNVNIYDNKDVIEKLKCRIESGYEREKYLSKNKTYDTQFIDTVIKDIRASFK